jgi:hypothetical protein
MLSYIFCQKFVYLECLHLDLIHCKFFFFKTQYEVEVEIQYPVVSAPFGEKTIFFSQLNCFSFFVEN